MGSDVTVISPVGWTVLLLLGSLHISTEHEKKPMSGQGDKIKPCGIESPLLVVRGPGNASPLAFVWPSSF